MSYAAKLVMHLNFGSKGSARQSELTEYPGVFVTDNYDKKARKATRGIFYNKEEFETLDSAVAKWKEDHEPRQPITENTTGVSDNRGSCEGK